MQSNLIRGICFRIGCAAVFSVLCIGAASLAYADTAIETETAQIGKRGDIGFSQAYEYGRAKDGTSGELVTQFEYGLSDRAEILIEPFFYTWEHPDGEKMVKGVGDLEITPSYEVILEDHWRPAVLTALKIKVPTGSEHAGSSGEFDYMPYLIFGQHFEGWTFNANLGVNITTPADGGEYGTTATWAVEAEREIVPDLTMVLEGFSTEDKLRTVSTALEYQWSEHFNTFAAVGYNQDDEAIFRLGINLQY